MPAPRMRNTGICAIRRATRWQIWETAMAYTLEDFCAESHALLKSKPLASALTQMADRLSQLLANPDFVTQTFNEDMQPGKRVLHHDPELDFYVMAHVQEGGKTGKPHSHGSSWAIYGNARAETEMIEWRRANPESDDHAELVAESKYSLAPGQTRAYGPNVIHSTAHPKNAWVIRITGTDLDKLPRYHFGKKDRILESA
jgi:predicted metal-dependent enzyme (double-stranded beta helix superfamily)